MTRQVGYDPLEIGQGIRQHRLVGCFELPVGEPIIEDGGDAPPRSPRSNRGIGWDLQ